MNNCNGVDKNNKISSQNSCDKNSVYQCYYCIVVFSTGTFYLKITHNENELFSKPQSLKYLKKLIFYIFRDGVHITDNL